jgi:methyltransferase (TIGR00027 family)
MRQGVPWVTAAAVAAYRSGFERLAAPFGDPAADEALSRDAAGSLEFDRSERMARYLQSRTSFFDRVVINGLGRGVSQVAAIGAGYDGRAWRYAKPGVRWFELDHPETQADKRLRLERLRLDVRHVTFVALDLTGGGTNSALMKSGWEPDAPSLMLCEGVAVYLEAAVLEMLLKDLRALATVGTRLAISLPPEDVEEVLADARWRRAALSERADRAGFAVAAPVWEPAADGAPPTASRIGAYVEQLYHRRGVDDLPRHLGEAYGIVVNRIRELDAGVFRVERRDGPDWVARVFPAARPLEASRGDAEILQFLERADFPAERCADAEPVTSHQGQGVLVTEHVTGPRVKGRRSDFDLLGDLLGRLHTLPASGGAGSRPGGAWHHLVFQGTPRDEIAATVALLDDAGGRVAKSQSSHYEMLREAVSGAEDCDDLPQALIHPDFVPTNAIAAASSGGPMLVDWTGAGRGPRLWSLGFLLWAAGARNLGAVDSVVSGYRRHVELEAAELARLAPAIAARPLIFASWGFSTGRESLADVVERLPSIRADAERIAARVGAAAKRDRSDAAGEP